MSVAGDRYSVVVGGREINVEVRKQGDETIVVVDGVECSASLGPADGGGLRQLRLGSNYREALVRRVRDRTLVAIDGVEIVAQVVDEREARLQRHAASRAAVHVHESVIAPMPGLVVRVDAAVGAIVTAGQCLVVLQAMKMENELGSPRDGTVKAIHVAPGQTVEHGQELVELE